MTWEEFKDKYCRCCGSQRCTGEPEWREGCKMYRQKVVATDDCDNNKTEQL